MSMCIVCDICVFGGCGCSIDVVATLCYSSRIDLCFKLLYSSYIE